MFEIKKGFLENGQKWYEHYYLNDKLHREDGPACQWWYDNGQKCYEQYYLNDKYHREDGPAKQSWDENGQKIYEEYCLNNKEISYQKFIVYRRKLKLNKLCLK